MPTLSDRNSHRFDDVLDFATDNDDTPGVNLGGFPILGLLVPALESTPTITVQVCIDGSNWYDLLTEDGSTAAISITGGATPFFVSSDVFTPLAAYTGSLQPVVNDVQVRLHLSAVQTANRTFTWIGVA